MVLYFCTETIILVETLEVDVLDQFTPAQTKSKAPSQVASSSGSTLPPGAGPSAGTSSTTGNLKTSGSVTPSLVNPDDLTDIPDEADVAGDELAASFARELSLGMESLMRDLGAGGMDLSSLGAVPGGLAGQLDGLPKDGTALTAEEEKENETVFKAAWEAMLVEGLGAEGAGFGEAFRGNPSTSSSASTAKPGEGEADFQKSIRQAMEKMKAGEAGLKVPLSSLRFSVLYR